MSPKTGKMFTGPEEYLRVFAKRKWFFIIPFISIILLGTAANKVQTPLYQATARILIEKGIPRGILGKEIIPSPSYYDYYYFFQSQLAVITSGTIMDKVARVLFPSASEEELRGKARMIRGSVSAIQADERRPGIVYIRAYHSSPEMAMKIANTVAEVYQKENFESQNKTFTETYSFLTERLLSLKKALEESQRALQKFKQEQGIVFLGGSDIDIEKLSEFNAEYISTRAKRLEMEVRLEQLRKLSPSELLIASSSFFPNNSAIQKLKDDLMSQKIKLAGLLQQYKEKYPEAIYTKSRIALVENMLKDEIQKNIISLETDYRSIQAKEEALLKAINEYKAEAQEVGKKQAEYAMLQQEVNTNKEIYLLLYKKLGEADITKGMERNNVRIIDYATLPRVPVRPRKGLNLMFSLLVGLFCGIGLVYVKEYLDLSFKDSEEVEQYLGLPVLGVIPYLRAKKGRRDAENKS